MIPKKPSNVTWTDDQWKAIYEDGNNILVSAGAGSGKTAVLTERVIRKLKDGIDIDRLLVLTFTNEAAREMKSRIRDAINKNNLTKQLNLLESAYITTFDSFALSIVKRYHYALNISKNITNIDSSIINIKKKELIEEIFENYYENNEDFKELISIFTTKDDTKIKEAILKISSELDKLIGKEEYLNNYLTNHYKKENIENIVNEYLEYLKEKKEEINTLYDNLLSYLEDKNAKKLIEAISPLFETNTYEEIKNNINPFPRLMNLDEDAKLIRDELKKSLKELENLTRYDSLEEIYNSLTQNQKYVKVIIDIILEIDKKINEYKFKYDAYEFNDIAIMAINVVKNNEEIRNELKYFFNEIMLDEYQDTSDIQETFISLIANKNVYCVGDQKQSIYRFRNANPFIFSNKYNEYAKGNGGVKIDLKDNFRSRKEVIESINELFSSIMDDKIGNASYKETHKMIFGNKSYEKDSVDQNFDLDIYSYELEKTSKKEEQEAFIIARDIKQKMQNNYLVLDKTLRKIKYSDICIIVDRSSNFNLYKKILEYENIPATICKDQNLTTGYDIIVIKHLLNLILKINKKEFDNDFKYSYTSVTRSFLFEFEDDKIYNELKNNKYDEQIINLCKQINAFEETPSTILNKIIELFNIYEKLILVGNIEESIIKIESLQKIAKNLTDQNYTPTMFLEYLTEMINGKDEIKYKINAESGDNVKIMTIHKSKGLQFALCYFLGFTNTFNMEDTKSSIFYNNKYGIIMPYYNEGIDDTIEKELVKKNYILDEVSEKIRLLYVALTRAKEKMIIVSPLKEKTKYIDVPESIKMKYRSFSDILETVEPLEKYIEIVDGSVDKDYIKVINKKIEDLETNDKKIFCDLNLTYEKIEEKHFSKTTTKLLSKEELEAMEYGTKIHEIFEMDDFNNPKHKYTKDFLKHIDKPLNIYKEHEFITENDDKGIIDILLEYSDHYKIIDYKLKNISDEAYIKQLKGYKAYIENLTNKKTYTYLYSVLEDKLIEIK